MSLHARSAFGGRHQLRADTPTFSGGCDHDRCQARRQQSARRSSSLHGMPVQIGCLVVLNRWMALLMWPIGGFGVFAVVVGGGLDFNSVFLLLIASLFGASPLVWVGRRGTMWLLAPWRWFRYSRVAYFDLRAGHWIQAEMLDGNRLGAVPHGYTFLDTPDMTRRREEFFLQLLEHARVASGGDPSPQRRVRPRTPLGEQRFDDV